LCSASVRALPGSGIPCGQTGLDVALEDFSQIVVAVELVFVGDASEGLNGVEYGHGGVACDKGQATLLAAAESAADG
jgi:hypothetical protein